MTSANNHGLQLFHKVVWTFQTLYLFPHFEDCSNYQTCCGNPEALRGISEGFVKPEQSHPLKSFYLLFLRCVIVSLTLSSCSVSSVSGTLVLIVTCSFLDQSLVGKSLNLQSKVRQIHVTESKKAFRCDPPLLALRALLASAQQTQPPLPQTLSVLESTPQVRGLHTIIRYKPPVLVCSSLSLKTIRLVITSHLHSAAGTKTRVETSSSSTLRD